MSSIRLLLCSCALVIGAQSAYAQPEGRFDAQVFRPSAAPRDLVMVEKSETIGHLSPTVGIYQDFALDPLVLVFGSDQTVEAVGARLQITALAGIGLFDWMDLRLAVPFVGWQTSDNLRSVGTEGQVRSNSVGDMRLSARVAIPGVNRRHRNSGLGMALVGTLNLPTGDDMAFAGDGVLTGGVSLIADYRINAGAVITANLGVWLRPERQFASVGIGNMASFGLAAETYIVQRWGLSVLGGVYGYPSLTSLPDSHGQIPAEALMGLRWQGKHGITWTFGGSFGAACGFGAPALRLFNGLTWTPSASREQEHIDRILLRNAHDPDHDGMTSDRDSCPNMAGPVENRGCPDVDRDGDGWVDREDECPDLPGGERGRRGCPGAYIKGDEIVIRDKVHFATNRDVILETSKPILEDVAMVLLEHMDIEEVRIEGHTDVRASDAYNMRLSQKRVSSVKRYLVQRGVDESRMKAAGYGHSRPLYDDSECDMPDEELSEDCRFMTSENRRVVFRIMRRGLRRTPPKADESLKPVRKRRKIR